MLITVSCKIMTMHFIQDFSRPFPTSLELNLGITLYSGILLTLGNVFFEEIKNYITFHSKALSTMKGIPINGMLHFLARKMIRSLLLHNDNYNVFHSVNT